MHHIQRLVRGEGLDNITSHIDERQRARAGEKGSQMHWIRALASEIEDEQKMASIDVEGRASDADNPIVPFDQHILQPKQQQAPASSAVTRHVPGGNGGPGMPAGKNKTYVTMGNKKHSSPAVGEGNDSPRGNNGKYSSEWTATQGAAPASQTIADESRAAEPSGAEEVVVRDQRLQAASQEAPEQVQVGSYHRHHSHESHDQHMEAGGRDVSRDIERRWKPTAAEEEDARVRVQVQRRCARMQSQAFFCWQQAAGITVVLLASSISTVDFVLFESWHPSLAVLAPMLQSTGCLAANTMHALAHAPAQRCASWRSCSVLMYGRSSVLRNAQERMKSSGDGTRTEAALKVVDVMTAGAEGRAR